MKMSGFERLKNLRSAKATRAIVILSIFLLSAGPGLAAGLLRGHQQTPINTLSNSWSKDHAPMKVKRIDPELLSLSKDKESNKDLFTHEETVHHPIPNPNRNNNCESSSYDLFAPTKLTGMNLDDSACRNRTGIWSGSGR
jgi:hypothetical protein